MKKILIISPSFPPVNAADMQRVRMSLPYYEKMGWKPIVLCVSPNKNERGKDELLLKTVSSDLTLYSTSAFSVRWSRKIGLGSLALRALPFLFNAGNKIIQKEKPDLIFFSTTDFPVMILGRFWKFYHNVPYVLDIQDMWYSTYYLDKPKEERPKKFWFSYLLNKFMEPFSMRKASGVMAVSSGYITILQDRYSNLTTKNCMVLPFGGFDQDIDVAKSLTTVKKDNRFISIRYVGRGGHDMKESLQLIFSLFRKGLDQNPELFGRVRFEFKGTSYAPNGKGIPTILPIAKIYDLENYVSEITDRVPYFESLRFLMESDLLFVPGSNDPNYTASKIYPYILIKKPILAIFHELSGVVSVLKSVNAGEVITFNGSEFTKSKMNEAFGIFNGLLEKIPFTPDTNWELFKPFTAEFMTKRMVDFFDGCLKRD